MGAGPEFDPTREPATPREAASVVLLRSREGDGQAEVFLLRRHRNAKFMATAFVFPGGIADEGDSDPRATAARELFEEAGVLLADGDVDQATRAAWRHALNHEQGDLSALLAAAGRSLVVDGLTPLAHWITPSAEKRRYSARFFVAELPAGQTPSFDNKETVDEVWATPAEALARVADLRLPPPQIRILGDLAAAAAEGPGAVIALARGWASRIDPILPRFRAAPDAPGGFQLLLPWDPAYAREGQGEAVPAFPPDHPLGQGSGRFVLDDGVWKNVSA